ncbi:SpoIID/LytB domain-containing protein [Nocardia huaxiensis]|uniref:SpoIID/LytB domain-containing protein n=1 Tax=Nocardia huaxiensis TaxID=2755382 RepID=A0A7D6VBM1_9NOCA|nr:SpoIID/LytB domain-containing protein [Nocardia huaxiensis]QLY31153.1 SpoIID/LytB domain-containing protein [Nocardia huaxiensis]UFS94684.1 SpoIID/LytB domain-containing protein [Nocardia huaxiensis]
MPNGYLRRRRRRRRLIALSLAAATLATATAGLLWAWPKGSIRPLAGPGHGRGLSQTGAFNQAVDGSTAEQILAHYYPGADLGEIAPVPVRVRIAQQDDSTLDVISESGLFVAGRRVIPGQAAHLTPTASGADVTITTGCDGEILWEGTTDDPWVYPMVDGTDRPAEEHLELCGGYSYRGVLGVTLENGEPRTVNEVNIEDYLLGVVPAEMVPNWADQGGTEALKAQAIAARSYALAESRYPYAETCDTTDCQMYPGTEKEDDRTSAAVRATAGRVLLRDSHILRSEYSAAPDGGSPMNIENLEVGPAVSEFPSAPIPSVEIPPDVSLSDLIPELLPSDQIADPATPDGTVKPVVPSGTAAPSTAITPTPPVNPVPLHTTPRLTTAFPKPQ